MAREVHCRRAAVPDASHYLLGSHTVASRATASGTVRLVHFLGGPRIRHGHGA